MKMLSGVRIMTVAIGIFALSLTVFGQEQQADYSKWHFCDFSHLFTTHKVSASFAVKVSSGADVPVTITAKSPEGRYYDIFPARAITVNTDENGIARFSKVRTGKYWLSAGELIPAGAEIDVTSAADSKARTGDDIEVHVDWPRFSHVVREMNGKLVFVESMKPKPLQDASVEIFDIRTGNLVAFTRTDVEGNYRVSGLAEGGYAVRFSKLGEPTQLDIGIEVKVNAKEEKLPVLVYDGECAQLSYLPQSAEN